MSERTTVTTEGPGCTGVTVTIERPGSLGVHQLIGALPIITRMSNAEPKRVTDGDLELFATRSRELREVVLRCCVEPKFVDKWPEDCGEGEKSTEELTREDFGYLTGELLKLAGFTKEVEEKLGPLSETETASPSSG
jgi:hypothetical protein